MKIKQCEQHHQSAISLWGTGKPRREYLHSDDCASALYSIMENYADSSPINVGAGIDHSIREIAEMTLRVLNKSYSLNFDLSKPDGTFQKLCDTQKLQHLGWRPQIPLELGIKDVYEQEVSKIIF
jgi:GDP-L-fucose synthase